MIARTLARKAVAPVVAVLRFLIPGPIDPAGYSPRHRSEVERPFPGGCAMERAPQAVSSWSDARSPRYRIR
jgi:hypothetical protein